MLIYDWGTKDSSLAFRLWPSARVLAADPLDLAATMISEGRVSVRPKESFLFHLSLTNSGSWPQERPVLLNWLEKSGARALNGRLGDVSKLSIQLLNQRLGLPSTRIDRSFPPETVVIIKTNWNYGGLAERRLSVEQRIALGVPLGNPRIDRFDKYEICEVAAVSEECWNDQHLMVERYIRNSRCAFYRCYFARDSVALSEAINPRPIQKMLPGLQRQNKCLDARNLEVDEPIATIVRNCLRFRRALALDYGALDVVVDDDGLPYIIDANPTPGWGDEKQPDIVTHLSAGLEQ